MFCGKKTYTDLRDTQMENGKAYVAVEKIPHDVILNISNSFKLFYSDSKEIFDFQKLYKTSCYISFFPFLTTS